MPASSWCLPNRIPHSLSPNSGELREAATPGFCPINKKSGDFQASLSFYDLTLPVAREKMTKNSKFSENIIP